MLATFLDEGSIPSTSTKRFTQYGGDWIRQEDKDMKRSTRITGEQVELAMAA